MIIKKINRYKPLYKNILSLRGVIPNLNKVLKFKKIKWKTFLFHLIQKEKKSNLFYRVFDQEVYIVPKFTSLFKRRFKQSLQNKRKLSLLYPGLTEKKLKQIIEFSIKKVLFSNSNFSVQSYVLEFLESRLDIIILRSHFVLSVRNSQQLIVHGHVFVNGNCVTKKNYLVKIGDVIEFSSSVHKVLVSYVSQSNLWPIPPKYIQVNYRIFQIIVVDRVLFTNISTNFGSFLNLNSVIKKYKF